MHEHDSDHDLLIELNGKCDTIIDHLATLNGRTGKNETDIVTLKLERAALIGEYDKRVSSIESRPSSRRTIVVVGAVVVAIQGLIAFGKSLFGG